MWLTRSPLFDEMIGIAVHLPTGRISVYWNDELMRSTDLVHVILVPVPVAAAGEFFPFVAVISPGFRVSLYPEWRPPKSDLTILCSPPPNPTPPPPPPLPPPTAK